MPSRSRPGSRSTGTPTSPRTLQPEQRDALAAHLDAALARGAPPRARADGQDAGRQRARDADRLPARVPHLQPPQARARRRGHPRVHRSPAPAGRTSAQVFERASGQPLTKGIPGLFTRDGYFKAFKRVGRQGRQAAGRRGALGAGRRDAGAPSAQADGRHRAGGDDRARAGAAPLPAGVHQGLGPVPRRRPPGALGGLERSLAVARVLAAPDSPLAAYLRAVARETQLGAAADAAAEAPSRRRWPAGLGAEERDKARAGNGRARSASRPAADDRRRAGGRSRRWSTTTSRRVHRLVDGQPAPIDDVLKLFNEVFVQLTAVDAAQKSKSAPPPPAAAAAPRPRPPPACSPSRSSRCCERSPMPARRRAASPSARA